jgi:hypothetical protein
MEEAHPTKGLAVHHFLVVFTNTTERKDPG